MVRDAVAHPQIQLGLGGDIRVFLQPDGHVLVRAQETLAANVGRAAHHFREIGKTLPEFAFGQVECVVLHVLLLPGNGLEDDHGLFQVAFDNLVRRVFRGLVHLLFKRFDLPTPQLDQNALRHDVLGNVVDMRFEDINL